MTPSDALPAIVCGRACEMTIIVVSAFKNLSSHEYFMNALVGVLVHKK